MMELENVTKTYQQGRRQVRAVRGVSLRVGPGEFVSIMGPSGSGKSTLMHLMGALDTPTSGKALFLGKDLNSLSDRERSHLRRTRIGFVFQFFNLLPTLTAVENVALPLLLGGQGRWRAHKQALAALEGVGLSERAEHFPEEMSGGEMQRVAIARALVTEPDAVLCDEPTNDLDVETLSSLENALLEFPGCAVITSHDRWFLDRIATHILAFEGDSKTVWCEGNYQTYEAQRRQRLGLEADQPHRLRYKKLHQ